MQSLLSAHANNFDLAMLAVWLLVSLRNKQSLLMLFCLVAYLYIQAATETNFCGFLITSAMFFILAAVNIRIPSEIRQAFVCFALVYLIGAADQAMYYHLDIDMLFDRIQPYLVTATNAYVLAYLVSRGGREGAKHNGLHIAAFCRRFFRLSLR